MRVNLRLMKIEPSGNERFVTVASADLQIANDEHVFVNRDDVSRAIDESLKDMHPSEWDQERFSQMVFENLAR